MNTNKSLYRKINTQCNQIDFHGGNYRTKRNKRIIIDDEQYADTKMRSKKTSSYYDYTPLYKFLLKKCW